ncbi:hypothetical protein L6164_032719 [Bauhinia variegata]|uniref:Uncharacterized protein n=1 Tax=Bauhinia variegata TaxID=167791 RepID=A0ACB9KPI3_BAUVA|nr:hypothetical protein L6164_032719 [Bauhinia variegata]
MPQIWHSLKRSLNCKLKVSEVHDPKARRHQKSAQRKEPDKLEPSKMKDSVKGSSEAAKRQSCSPKSNSSSNILNPVTHEIVLDSFNGEIKLFQCYPCPCPPQGCKDVKQHQKSTRSGTSSGNSHDVDCKNSNFSSRVSSREIFHCTSNSICHICGQKSKKIDAVEAHYVSEHSVIELQKEDSSWQIIDTICKTSRLSSENNRGQIESVLKVQNMPKAIASFEEYRDMVKTNAGKLQKKHPRCLADGNELLRFHGTTVACSMGRNGSSSLCTLDHCGLCQILRHGFSTKNEFHGSMGVLTASTSRKACDSIVVSEERPLLRKSVIVCRVIAGRVHNPRQEIQEEGDFDCDSFANKISSHSDIEELYLLDPRALLPCFVVIYKPENHSIQNQDKKGSHVGFQ